MHFPVITIFTLLSVAVAGLAAPTKLTVRSSMTETGDATYFYTGLGACGNVNKNSDLIVAASHTLFDTFPGATANPNNNPICGRQMTVKYQGRSVTVTVEDRCVGCGTNDIDLSPAAFSQLANQDLGRIEVSWTLWDY